MYVSLKYIYAFQRQERKCLPEYLFDNMSLTFNILTLKSNPFVFDYNCAKDVNLIKFPPAVFNTTTAAKSPTLFTSR